MEVQFLQAEYGDAIIIKTESNDKSFTIVVDGGPESSADTIAQQLVELGHIDLLVLTHFDEDHILGLIKYVELFKNRRLPVDRFWCNCAQKIDLAGVTKISETRYENANTLAEYLRKQSVINPSFKWTEDITTTTEPFKEGDLRIEILSPTRDVLNELKEGYEIYYKEHDWVDSEERTSIGLVGNNPDTKKSIDDLVLSDKPHNVNLWNKASIAFLLTAEGKRVLMLGDADADIVAESIENIYGEEAVLDIDLVKLSHHGSKHNISKRLLSHIKCNDFVISTNGGAINFCHPDRKTIALVLRNANKEQSQTTTFHFNYPIDEIQKRTGLLLSDDEKKNEQCCMIENAFITL